LRRGSHRGASRAAAVPSRHYPSRGSLEGGDPDRTERGRRTACAEDRVQRETPKDRGAFLRRAQEPRTRVILRATDWAGRRPVQRPSRTECHPHGALLSRTDEGPCVLDSRRSTFLFVSALPPSLVCDCPSETLPSPAISDAVLDGWCRGAWPSRHAVAIGWRWARVPLHVLRSLCGPDRRYCAVHCQV